jgi:hypothetical protein
MSRAIIESRCRLAVDEGGVLEADLILGRIAGVNLDNHLFGFVESSPPSLPALLAIGDVGSEARPVTSPNSFSAELPEYSCWFSLSSCPSPISLNIDFRPLGILLTIENDGSGELSRMRSEVRLESNLGRTSGSFRRSGSGLLWITLPEVILAAN